MALTEEEKAIFDGVVSLLYESDEFEKKFDAFAREHCQKFDGEEEEQRLEYTDVYLKYRETFELARKCCRIVDIALFASTRSYKKLICSLKTSEKLRTSSTVKTPAK